MDNNGETASRIIAQETNRQGGIIGDFFFAGQRRGIAGGHGNNNTLVNGDEAIMKLELQRMKGLMQAKRDNVDLEKCQTSLGLLLTFKAELDSLEREVDKVTQDYEGRRKKLQK